MIAVSVQSTEQKKKRLDAASFFYTSDKVYKELGFFHHMASLPYG